MRKISFMLLLACASVTPALAQSSLKDADLIVDRISARERALVKDLDHYTPIAETYLQLLGGREKEKFGVIGDHYFLSQARIGSDVDVLAFKGARRHRSSVVRLGQFLSPSMEYLPEGFVSMAHPSMWNFDRDYYDFKFMGGETLAGVNCLLFDVLPKAKYSSKEGMFDGRIWVEDQNYSIIRYLGDFTGGGDWSGHYFHFDSRRVKCGPALWLPALIYSSETDYGYNKLAWGHAVPLAHARFKAQTRFWGYRPGTSRQSNEAQGDVLDWLEGIGLMAPKGDVDTRLQAITHTLEAANDLHLDARCRELLTTKLEVFTVGRTIVISRGLLDVVPDEGALAFVLALGLARMASDTTTESQIPARFPAFDPADTFLRLSFASAANSRRSIEELAARYVERSPYKGLESSGQDFLTEISAKSPRTPELVAANLGDGVGAYSGDRKGHSSKDESSWTSLPLGSRTSVDPWSSTLEVALDVREKVASHHGQSMEVEVTLPDVGQQSASATSYTLPERK